MAEQINYAEAYQKAIQEGFYPTNLYSSALYLSPSNAAVSFIGAKVIKLPKLSIDAGRTNHTRRSATAIVANYSDDWIPMQLKNEREWSTLVDPLDIDETNQVVSIANVTRQFNIDEKMPEQDRYMFSKLYQEKVKYDAAKGIYTETLDESNVLKAFDDMMEQMDEDRVPVQGRILYITPRVYAILKRADAVNRQVLISDPGNLSRSVHSLDQVTIVEVPSDLMQTAFDFTVGSKLENDAKQIDMMLINNGVQIAPEKYSFVGFDQPNAANGGNYLYREISYGDVFLLPTKTAGIAFSVSDKVVSGSNEEKEQAATFDPTGDVKPTDSNTIAEITAWLDAHSVDHTGKTSKADLLALVPAE